MLKKSMIRNSYTSMMLVSILATVYVHNNVDAQGSDRIRPYEANPYFWQYKGEPVLLLGGSKQDNLFNHPDGLEEHLDLLVACGGNYVRNTMSSRDEGNPYWFHLNEETGLYDMYEMGEAFWERFSNFLKITAERDIIVQIEVFDRFDYAQENWQKNPFNPKNNVNYTVEDSGLPEVINSHPGQRENPFFRSVPNLENNTVLLPWQQVFVNQMLSYSLQYGHVLYCISNETNESEEWGAYWANYIRSAASDFGVEVHVTEMWDHWDLTHPAHNRTIDHPETYTFIDISQNNHINGQAHWDNTQYVRNRIKENPRPINNVKMYGGITHGGGLDEGLRRMWRNVLGGMASARFHRPGPMGDAGPMWGAGLGPEAQAYIRSVRYLMNDMGWPNIEPTLSFVTIATDHAHRVRTEKTHVVYTRDSNGHAYIYLDGIAASEMTVGGDLSNWSSNMRLALGTELTGDRHWLGTYHEVILYNRALDATEVAAHFNHDAPVQDDSIQARYHFEDGAGNVVHDVSGHEPALNLLISNPDAVSWTSDGLRVNQVALIASENPAERLASSVQNSNAFTLEVWLTPAEAIQSGPARIVTLSSDHSNRNFTLGQSEDAYQMRLRSTGTSANGMPALQTHSQEAASIAAMKSPDGERAAIFVSHGALLDVDASQLKEGLQAQWFDPRNTAWLEAATTAEGYYQPPTTEDWLLVLR